MRWKNTYEKPEKPSPVGEIRVKNHFAFLPITIGDETRWLEYVVYQQVLKDGQPELSKKYGTVLYVNGTPAKNYWEDFKFLLR